MAWEIVVAQESNCIVVQFGQKVIEEIQIKLIAAKSVTA